MTRYLNEPLSAGLAASDLAEFVKQRCRWCLGTLQCLWLPAGPLRSRRLSLLDRLCLLDPIAFYVSYLYILLTLLAPAVYWWTGTAIFHSDLGHVLNMLAPRMGASMIVLYWISGRRVVPVVSEVGRAVGIFQLSRAVIQGLLRPFSGTFQVTLKGTQRDRPQVQWPLLRPFLLLAAATAAGMTVNVAEVYHPTFWSEDLGMNVALTAFVAWLLFLCCLTCVDRPSRELSTRPGTIHGSLARSVRAVVLRIVR